MPAPERFSDGSFRFNRGGTTFTFYRLRPGVVLTTASGFDRGEVGDAPLRAIEAEMRWFRRPVEWFIDARRADNAASPVFTRWTEWLGRNAGMLKRLHVLTGGEPMRLTVSIARHLSGAAGVLSLYEDPAAFRSAIVSVVPSFAPVTAEAAPVDCDVVRSSRLVEVKSNRSAWTIETLPPSTLVTRVSGNEDGTMADLLFDEVERALTALQPEPAWFVDLTGVRTISSSAVDNWAGWVDVRRGELRHVHVLAATGATGLLLAISQFRSNLGHIIRLYDSREQFEADLRSSNTQAAGSGSGR